MYSGLLQTHCCYQVLYKIITQHHPEDRGRYRSFNSEKHYFHQDWALKKKKITAQTFKNIQSHLCLKLKQLVRCFGKPKEGGAANMFLD